MRKIAQSISTTGWDGWGRPIVAAGVNPPAPATKPPQEPPAPLPQPQTHDTPLAAQPSGMGGSTYGYPTQFGSQTSTLMSKTATGRPDQYVGWRNYYLVSKNSDRNDPRGFRNIPEKKNGEEGKTSAKAFATQLIFPKFRWGWSCRDAECMLIIVSRSL